MICSRDGTLLCYEKKNNLSFALRQMGMEDIVLSKIRRHRNTNIMQFATWASPQFLSRAAIHM